MAGTALVAIPDADGNPGPSNPPQQGEHCLHTKQTGPDPSSLPQVNVTDVSYFKTKDFRKGLYLLSRPHGGKVHKDNISHTSTSGVGTAVQDHWIPFQQL